VPWRGEGVRWEKQKTINPEKNTQSILSIARCLKEVWKTSGEFGEKARPLLRRTAKSGIGLGVRALRTEVRGRTPNRGNSQTMGGGRDTGCDKRDGVQIEATKAEASDSDNTTSFTGEKGTVYLTRGGKHDTAIKNFKRAKGRPRLRQKKALNERLNRDRAAYLGLDARHSFMHTPPLPRIASSLAGEPPS